MRNYVQPGNTVTLTAPYAVASGDGLLAGSVFGVAAGDAALGEPVEAALTGVFDLPKVPSQAWSLGDPVYWDGGNHHCTNVPSSHKMIGAAVLAVGGSAGEIVGRVRLGGGVGIEPLGRPLAVAGFDMAATPGAANVTEIVVTARDGDGAVVAEPVLFDLWLSDDAGGEGLTGTAASGNVEAKSGEGTVVASHVAKKALRVQALKTGSFTLKITDSGKTAFVVCAQAPGTGRVVPGLTLAPGDYGA